MTVKEMVKTWEGMTPEQRELTSTMCGVIGAHMDGLGTLKQLLDAWACPNDAASMRLWNDFDWPFKFTQSAEHPAPESVQ